MRRFGLYFKNFRETEDPRATMRAGRCNYRRLDNPLHRFRTVAEQIPDLSEQKLFP